MEKTLVLELKDGVIHCYGEIMQRRLHSVLCVPCKTRGRGRSQGRAAGTRVLKKDKQLFSAKHTCLANSE